MATAPQDHIAGYTQFLEAFEDAIARAPKSTAGVSIALIDIDQFGQINEAHGQDYGDAVIALLAAALADSIADNGQVFRYGGDAFMVLFENIEKEQAFLHIEEARKSFDAPHSVTVSGKKRSIEVSISCGVAAYPDDAAKPNEVIRKCSEALYRAKISGRNKVSLAREEKMVTKTTHYTTGQLDGLQRLAKREGLNEATLLREALDDILRKYNS